MLAAQIRSRNLPPDCRAEKHVSFTTAPKGLEADPPPASNSDFVYNDADLLLWTGSMARAHFQKGAQDDSSQTNPLELLKSLGAAAGVLTGHAFIYGWLYWATYYTAFGLNSLVLDLPFSVVSVSLAQVLVRDWKTESGHNYGARHLGWAHGGLGFTTPGWMPVAAHDSQPWPSS
jgi:hypothetical protein